MTGLYRYEVGKALLLVTHDGGDSWVCIDPQRWHEVRFAYHACSRHRVAIPHALGCNTMICLDLFNMIRVMSGIMQGLCYVHVMHL